MNKKIFLIIFVIILLTISLRFININSVPPHLSNDEISIGYDAYSVLKTLKDGHNHFLPLSFQSYNTFKAPITIYLTIPSIAIFGNNNFAVRAPSAILGSLTVLIIGLLVFELSKNKGLSLACAFILAITPYHILTSRMAFEPNIALFFFITGIYLFFVFIRNKSPLLLFLSTLSFALSIYGYHTEWIYTPFIMAFLLITNRKLVWQKKLLFIWAFFLFLILLFPIFSDYLNNLNSSTRANTETLLKEVHLSNKLSDPQYLPLQKIIFIFQVFWEKYSSYFNLSFIFFTGLELLQKYDPFEIGLFLFPLLPLFFIGIIYSKEFFKQNSTLLYTLVLSAPIIPSLTLGPQSHSRNLISVIPISIFCGVGLMFILKKIVWKIIFWSFFTLSFVYFLIIFFYHFPKDAAQNYEYGYEQIADYIKPRFREFKTIIIDPRFGSHYIYSGVPHMYIPFYTYLDPTKLQNAVNNKEGSFFDKYQIREIDWKKEKIQREALYILPADNAPLDVKLEKIYTITLPNMTPAFYLYKSI